MQADSQKNFPEKIIEGIIYVLKVIGSTFLALMMFLTAVDVACRYVLNSPISGALELVEYMMAVLIPFSIAYCAFCKSHVAVELIMDLLPRKVQTVFYVPVTLLTALFLLLITWQTILYTIETFESKLTSSVLLIVTYPFVIPVAIGTGIFALILIHELFQFSWGEK